MDELSTTPVAAPAAVTITPAEMAALNQARFALRAIAARLTYAHDDPFNAGIVHTAFDVADDALNNAVISAASYLDCPVADANSILTYDPNANPFV